MEQLLSRIKQMEKLLNNDYLEKRIKELLIKQNNEFTVLKESLIATVEDAVNSMKLGTKIHQRRSKKPVKHNLSSMLSQKDEY